MIGIRQEGLYTIKVHALKIQPHSWNKQLKKSMNLKEKVTVVFSSFHSMKGSWPKVCQSTNQACKLIVQIFRPVSSISKLTWHVGDLSPSHHCHQDKFLFLSITNHTFIMVSPTPCKVCESNYNRFGVSLHLIQNKLFNLDHLTSNLLVRNS